jgi:kynureninase
MQLQPEFIPQPGADGWQIRCPPILAMAPIVASYDLFDEVGLPALRRKSELQTAYLQYLIDRLSPEQTDSQATGHWQTSLLAACGLLVITPREPESRGCQLSLLIQNRPEELLSALKAQGVICDFRKPNVIRAAPVPFYNTFHDIWVFAQVLAKHERTC